MTRYSELPDLQVEQQRHDDIAHRDILSLGVQDRVKHMVLHFAKYAGHFAEVQETRDEARFIATLVDTFIICLACANALNYKLAEILNRMDVEPDESDSIPENPVIELAKSFFTRFVKTVGPMAKACESLD